MVLARSSSSSFIIKKADMEQADMELEDIVNDPIVSKRIKSNKLLGLKKRCPDDGAWMTSTGYMYLIKATSDWAVEYLCPKDGELIRSWSPEVDATTRQIAKEILPKTKRNE